MDRFGSVKDHMIRSRVFSLWNIQPWRDPNDWEVEEMGKLLESHERYEMGDMELQDEMIWHLDEANGFSVKSMYLALCSKIVPSHPGECVWNRLIQLKVYFLMWELWDRAPTMDNLIRRGMIIPNVCCLCMMAAESLDHLFIHCSWVTPF